jgi:predicted membrane protein
MTTSGWNITDPVQVMSLFGSMLILIAYAITVHRPARRRLYCSISLAGGILLLIVALIYRNLGLTLLEIAWIAINLWGLWHTRATAKATGSVDAR